MINQFFSIIIRPLRARELKQYSTICYAYIIKVKQYAHARGHNLKIISRYLLRAYDKIHTIREYAPICYACVKNH